MGIPMANTPAPLHLEHWKQPLAITFRYQPEALI